MLDEEQKWTTFLKDVLMCFVKPDVINSSSDLQSIHEDDDSILDDRDNFC